MPTQGETGLLRCGDAFAQILELPATDPEVMLDNSVQGLLLGGREPSDTSTTKVARRELAGGPWAGRHFELHRGAEAVMVGDAFIRNGDGTSRIVVCWSPRRAEYDRRCSELVTYLARYGRANLPASVVPTQSAPSLPTALAHLQVPIGCKGPGGTMYQFSIRCSDGEMTWKSFADASKAESFLAMALDGQRKWLLDGLVEAKIACSFAGVATTCHLIRGKTTDGPITSFFASAQVEDKQGIVSCTYRSHRDELPRACALAFRLNGFED